MMICITACHRHRQYSRCIIVQLLHTSLSTCSSNDLNASSCSRISSSIAPINDAASASDSLAVRKRCCAPLPSPPWQWSMIGCHPPLLGDGGSCSYHNCRDQRFYSHNYGMAPNKVVDNISSEQPSNGLNRSDMIIRRQE